MYIQIYICISICTHVYISIYEYLYVCINHIYKYIRIQINIYIYLTTTLTTRFTPAWSVDKRTGFATDTSFSFSTCSTYISEQMAAWKTEREQERQQTVQQQTALCISVKKYEFEVFKHKHAT